MSLSVKSIALLPLGLQAIHSVMFDVLKLFPSLFIY